MGRVEEGGELCPIVSAPAGRVVVDLHDLEPQPLGPLPELGFLIQRRLFVAADPHIECRALPRPGVILHGKSSCLIVSHKGPFLSTVPYPRQKAKTLGFLMRNLPRFLGHPCGGGGQITCLEGSECTTKAFPAFWDTLLCPVPQCGSPTGQPVEG